MLIPESVFNVVGATDPESSRYALGAVQLRRCDDTCEAVATDGRQLIVAQWDDSNRDEHPSHQPSTDNNWKTLVASGQWKEAGKLLAKCRRIATRLPILGNLVVHEGDNGNVEVCCNDLETTRSLKFPVMDGKFPEYSKVLPADDAMVNDHEAVTIRLDAALLAGLVKMVATTSGEGKIDVMVPKKRGIPIVLKSVKEETDIKATGILMPLE